MNGGMQLTGLPPILDARIEILILGSFPSPASLAAQQYYAHRQNQFWRIMAQLTGEPLSDYDYRARQRALLKHHVGVWDVYRSCQREGALDSAIRETQVNDFSRLRAEAPQLRCVAFNGKESARFEESFRRMGYTTCILPSTSPAYTLAFQSKLERWRKALQPCLG